MRSFWLPLFYFIFLFSPVVLLTTSLKFGFLPEHKATIVYLTGFVVGWVLSVLDIAAVEKAAYDQEMFNRAVEKRVKEESEKK